MAGRGRFLAVVYHEGTPSTDGTQKMGYSLYDAGSPSAIRVVSKGSLACLSKGASLFWVGFGNDGALMAMDTDGMLSMLVVAADTSTDSMSLPCPWEWSPVLDTVGMRKSSDDQFWPVTVYDGKLVCVPLRGGTSYPDAARRPVTTTLHLRLPLAKSLIPIRCERPLILRTN
jgi:chromosome transmission fidelity protein 4